MPNCHECADDKWLYFSQFRPGQDWTSFCKALEIAALEEDPRFESAERRERNHEELISIIDGVIAEKALAEWLSILQDCPDFLYESVKSVSELATDPQMLANDYIVQITRPVLGLVKMLSLPVALSETPESIRTTAPTFGRHTEGRNLSISVDTLGPKLRSQRIKR